jgi:hypothetical protein
MNYLKKPANFHMVATMNYDSFIKKYTDFDILVLWNKDEDVKDYSMWLNTYMNAKIIFAVNCTAPVWQLYDLASERVFYIPTDTTGEAINLNVAMSFAVKQLKKERDVPDWAKVYALVWECLTDQWLTEYAN